MFVACIGLISIDAIYSLANMGLLSIGLMSLTVLCTFAGIFFGLNAGLYSMGCGALTAALIGAGICSGIIPTKPDIVRHLTEPITWFIQIACFVMYVVPLILIANFVRQRMTNSLQQLKESNTRLQSEISDRRSTEAALQESETKYRSVVENSLAAFFILQDGLFRFINNQFCEVFGYTHKEIIDRLGPKDLLNSEESKPIFENLEKGSIGDFLTKELVLSAVRKDGKVIALKMLGNILSFHGKPAFSGTLVDISKETSLESQLRQAQKMEAIGTLAGGIAHDFNNIINALTGYGTLLQLKMEKNNPLRLYVDQILSASQKATSLTQKILAFGRRQPLSLKPMKINALVGESEGLLKRLISEDILFLTDLSSEDPTIMADSTQIDQILFNLVTNAKDAMPVGGILKITTRIVELDREFIITHGFGKKGRYALLEVSDSGMGMNEEIRTKIFDPFFTTKEVGKGTGLGLSTVYGIVKQHGGYIVVYSQPDQGTVIHIYLPITKTTVHETRISSAESARSGKETILVADDDEDVRRLITEILSQFGYKVIEAVDGIDAIHKCRDHKGISLVILDSIMPRKNGREAYEVIKQECPEAKVLFMSGYTANVVLDQGTRELDFIAKPLSLDDFIMQVGKILEN
jgi:two-component system cell cycle sensor histidine kinase/response regulator CckA